MKIIELTEVGELDSKWFWNTYELECSNAFHPFLSFAPFDCAKKILINSDAIEELKDGFPTTHARTATYVKRNRLVEFFFNKKYKHDFKTTTSKDKVTWIKLSTGKTFYVNETVEQIRSMINDKNDDVRHG